MRRNEMIPYGRQSIDDADKKAVLEVLEGDWLTGGPNVEKFEQALASYAGAKHAVAVNSGTSALDIAVASLGIPPGSEVITTPLTFVASSNCLLYNNLKPVFSDVEKDTRNLDPASIEKRITKKTKAILCVDYAGHPCEYKQLREIADKHGLFLIDDACHALGAEYHGKKVGSLADATIYSFHPVKLITTGEGGAVLTDDEEKAALMRSLRSHGIDKDVRARAAEEKFWVYDMKRLGRNYRITDFQCALGLSQLKKLDSFIKKRNELAKKYGKLLADSKNISAPKTRQDVLHAWHLYTTTVPKKDRDAFMLFMRKNGVGVNLHYIPVYRHSFYKAFASSAKDCPVAEELADSMVTLPLYPNLPPDDLEKVAETCKSFWR